MHHYLLFHSLTEIGVATICLGTFLFAWNTQRFQNGFFLVLGITAGFVGLFGTLHCLAFPGMNVFEGYDQNLSPQLWLAARTFEAGALVAGLLAIDRKVKPVWLLVGEAAVFIAACTAIFSGALPDVVLQPKGLTTFKIAMEWILASAFIVSIPLLHRVRNRFSVRVYRLLIANSSAMALTEICFTLYTTPYDAANLAGHVLLLASVALQYLAVLRVGLLDPNEAHFRTLAQAERELREADRRKNEFLAVLSHELRNPLAPIHNGLHLLGQAPHDSERAERAVAIIRRQANYMTRLIDDLLDVTRISRGKIRLEKAPAELRELTLRTADDYRATFASNGISFDVRVSRDALWLEADATRIAQIIGNLLGNAVKFTPRGGRVELTLDVEDAGADGTAWAVLRVRDTGAGIEPAALERLFEPFVQVNQTLDRSRGGLGLGLSLVKGLTELHGGTARAFSTGRGAGTLFEVRLPLKQRQEGSLPTAPAAPKEPKGFSHRRILLIEDNIDAGDSLKEVLDAMGHEVHVARSGVEGIDAALEIKPEIVLCDVGLPDLDGYEVARRLRAQPVTSAMLLVAVTGYASSEDVVRSKEAGFDRHLPKPLDLDKIEALLACDAASGTDRPAAQAVRGHAPVCDSSGESPLSSLSSLDV